MKYFFLLILISIACTSCWYVSPAKPERKVLGYKPVYSTDPSLLSVKVSDAKAVKNAGKIYTIGNLIFQNEVGSGLHVFDYSNPVQPLKAGFINIPGNTEVSVKGNFLYANSFADLLVIDISDWKKAVEVKRIKGAFRQGYDLGYNFTIPPPEHNVYYECATPGRGVHTGWIKDSISTYSCYYQ